MTTIKIPLTSQFFGIRIDGEENKNNSADVIVTFFPLCESWLELTSFTIEQDGWRIVWKDFKRSYPNGTLEQAFNMIPDEEINYLEFANQAAVTEFRLKYGDFWQRMELENG